MFAQLPDPSWFERFGYPVAQNLAFLYGFIWLAKEIFIPLKNAHIENINKQQETNNKIVETQNLAVNTQQKICEALEFVKTHVSRINCPPACLHSCPVDKKVPAQ